MSVVLPALIWRCIDTTMTKLGGECCTRRTFFTSIVTNVLGLQPLAAQGLLWHTHSQSCCTHNNGFYLTREIQ